MRDTIIRATGLGMCYGGHRVLDGLDLTVGRGEVVALLGPNGAGKTTTMEILEGLRAPTEGSVEVLGVNPLHGDDAWRARMGVVLQSWRDHPRWRVGELLGHMGSFCSGFSTAQVTRPWPTTDLLERVGLADKENAQLRSLSGGQRRRLDVALGLVGRPELVFLDEPTASFDPAARRDFHDLIRELADGEVTILLTTHDLDEAARLADRILILAGGRIKAEGSPDELRRKVSDVCEVRWRADGIFQVHSTRDATAFLRELLTHPGDITDIEVTRATLEDAYMRLITETQTQLAAAS